MEGNIMKKFILVICSALIVLVTLSTVHAQQGLFAKKKPLSATRGKASVKELGKEIFMALQNGNTDRLNIYLPSDVELKELRKNNQTTDETKDIVEKFSAVQLETNLQDELTALKNQLSSNAIRVNDATLVSVTGTRADPKTPNIIPVSINLTDEKQKSYTLTFEALRIEKRVFLFRQLQAKPQEMQAVNVEKAEKAKP
jgi:putative ubiquitin-RnfH superfamily antitoxin RatB of RatAB toxin-antitoxin module